MNYTTKKRKVKTHKKTFTRKDYNSGDGMLTKVWGPALWHYLHIMSFNYPVNPSNEDKKNYRDFILNLQFVMPCKYCRINLRNNFKKKPLLMCYMKNRSTFSKYIYDLHELINRMLGKKSGLSYCDIRERYEHFRSRCSNNIPKVFKFNKTKKKKENGCIEPLYGKKSKCIINIVPQEDKRATLQINKKCLFKRKNNSN
jgi:hypothetical protein